MRWLRPVPLLLTAIGLVALTGALGMPGRRPPRAVEDWPELPGAAVVHDPTGADLLHRAWQSFQSPPLTSFRAGVRLRVRLPGLTYQGEGFYLRAPGQRYRLELRTRLDGVHSDRFAAGTLVIVSDGRDEWQASRVGAGSWRGVRRLRLSAILDDQDSPARLPPLRDEFLQGPAVHGPETVLRTLRDNLRWSRPQTQGQVTTLCGTWRPELISAWSSGRDGWPVGQPRVCRVTLSESLWPARVEWFGPTEEGSERNRLLVELEFLAPAMGRATGEIHGANSFRFDPGAAPIEDVTPQVQAHIARRAQELSPAK